MQSYMYNVMDINIPDSSDFPVTWNGRLVKIFYYLGDLLHVNFTSQFYLLLAHNEY